MEAFFTTAEQVGVMLILILLGFLLARLKIFNDDGVKCITTMVLYFVTPCVIIKSFVRPFDTDTLKNIGLSFAGALAAHIIYILTAHLVIHDKRYSRESVLRYSIVFANCGYMALPLLQAIIDGDDGVLYATSFIAIFNLIAWSYGIILISGDKKYMSPKKMLINPGIIALAIGFVVFICSIELPDVIYKPIEHLSFLNTPLPMMIIGYHLSKADFKKCFTDLWALITIAIRLILMPAVVLGALYLCGMRGNMLIASVVCAAAPVAANTTMFSAKFGQDTELSVNMVSLSTVISVATIPIIVALTKIIA